MTDTYLIKLMIARNLQSYHYTVDTQTVLTIPLRKAWFRIPVILFLSTILVGRSAKFLHLPILQRRQQLLFPKIVATPVSVPFDRIDAPSETEAGQTE